MIRQRPVREAESIRFIDDVNNATSVQGPHPAGPCFNRHSRAFFDLHIAWHKRHPTKVKLPPLLQRRDRARVNVRAASELDAIVIHVVAAWRHRSISQCGAYFAVTERKL